ncbi:MAG: hypothetical protein AB1347_09310 [Acidobacteriota bacterium]
MRRRRTAALLAALLSAGWASAAPRPYQGDGACLSCHQRSIPVLPDRPCLSCHQGNMDFLRSVHPGSPRGEFLTSAALGLAGPIAPLGAALLLRVLPGSPNPPPPPSAPATPPPGALLAARGHACDLRAVFSPDGGAVLFGRRGPDTTGDGAVDLRDGQALFLLPRDSRWPIRLTGYVLDFAPAMAAWSHDGSRLVVPLPLSDTDGDGAIAYSDRHGLALFDRRGARLAALPPEVADAVDPFFSPDGNRIAFVEGGALRVWIPDSGSVETSIPDDGGTFPRLAGWAGDPPVPVFTRGEVYAAADRSGDRRRLLPPRPLEAVVSGKAGPVSRAPSGERWSRGAASRGTALCMVQAEPGPRRVAAWSGGTPSAVTPPSLHVFAFAPSNGEETWVLVRGGADHALLGRAAAGRFEPAEVSFSPHLLGLAAGEGFAVACGPRPGRPDRPVVVWGEDGATLPFGAGGRWYRPSAAGSAAAAVRVPSDTDGDGERTPLDLGELWIVWEVP